MRVDYPGRDYHGMTGRVERVKRFADGPFAGEVMVLVRLDRVPAGWAAGTFWEFPSSLVPASRRDAPLRRATRPADGPAQLSLGV